ncbi:hypothetical protein V8F20_012251 [Naviculisporaceae sp. PSN 640]
MTDYSNYIESGFWPEEDVWRVEIEKFPEYKIIKTCILKDHSPTAIKDGVDAIVRITKHAVARIEAPRELRETAFRALNANNEESHKYKYLLYCGHLRSENGAPHSWIERHINVVWYSIMSLGLSMSREKQAKLLDFIFELRERELSHPDEEVEMYLYLTYNKMWADASDPAIWIGRALQQNLEDREDLEILQTLSFMQPRLEALINLAAQLYLRRHENTQPEFYPPKYRHLACAHWLDWSINKIIGPVMQPFFNAPWQNRNRPLIPEPQIRAACLWIEWLAPQLYEACIEGETNITKRGLDPAKVPLTQPSRNSYAKWRNGLRALLRHQQPTCNPYVLYRKRLDRITEKYIANAIDCLNDAEEQWQELERESSESEFDENLQPNGHPISCDCPECYDPFTDMPEPEDDKAFKRKDDNTDHFERRFKAQQKDKTRKEVRFASAAKKEGPESKPKKGKETRKDKDRADDLESEHYLRVFERAVKLS